MFLAAIATAVLVALVGACTPTNPPVADSTYPSTSSPSVAPSASATISTPSNTSTAGADELAIQAAQRYLLELNNAFKSGRTDQFRTTFIPACIICTQDAERIDSWTLSGRRLDGGELSYDSIRGSSQLRVGRGWRGGPWVGVEVFA